MAAPEWIPTAKILEKVERYAFLGLSQQQIADALGIGVSTLYAKKNEYTEFLEAIKRGQSSGIAYVADALIKNVDLGNPATQIFYLKARAGWSDHTAIVELNKRIDKLMGLDKEIQHGEQVDRESDS